MLSQALPAQPADTISKREVAAGATHTRFVRLAGPWIVNVLTVDLRRPDLAVRHVRAHDELRTRERTSDMVKRLASRGERVLAAVNADFFDLKTGENENEQVIDGEWWKGLKVTESPFDTFDNVHAQFALDALGRPSLDRFQFAGEALAARVVVPLIALNAMVQPGPEGAALFTPRFGAATPRDSGRTVAELPLIAAGRRGDTLVYLRGGAVSAVSGGAIPAAGAVLAGYGPRARKVAELASGDTVRIVLSVLPAAAHAAPPSLLVGGWPRILRDGVDIAATSASEEGTISGNAEVRHPRTAIGFSRDSSTLLLVTVDGRSKASVGMTLVELAALMKELGAWQALNFDGGGSTTMVVEDRIVNAPSDSAGERAVGNALLLTKRIAGSGRPGAPDATAATATQPLPAIPALDSARLLADLSALAADSMEGRRIGTAGGARARAYLLRALARIGLSPVPEGFATPFSANGRGGGTLAGVNLSGMVRGTRHPDRYVVVSAHYDHLGVGRAVNGDSIYNGADDNASGTAGVLAIAQWVKDHPPENSVLFALFDGEEAGDIGSKAFVDHPPVALERIIANVNLDMVGRNVRGELYASGATPWPVMRPLLDSVAAVAPVKLLLGHDGGFGQDNWINQSDQGSFHAKKIPFVYFGVEDHPDYHKPSDDLAHVQPGFFFHAVQTVAEFVTRLDKALDRVAAVR
ncbi:MAG: M28 family peptidase [Gemmatimonadales bacterium]